MASRTVTVFRGNDDLAFMQREDLFVVGVCGSALSGNDLSWNVFRLVIIYHADDVFCFFIFVAV